MPREQPLAVVRLHPLPHRTLYVRASVWRTKALLHAALAGNHGLKRLRSTIGCCCEVVVHSRYNGRCRRDPIVAEVHFWARYLTEELVAHELLHATFAYARRCGMRVLALGEAQLGPVPAEEEELCHVHGAMVQQFMRRTVALRTAWCRH